MANKYITVHDHVKQAERFLNFAMDEINNLNREAVPIKEFSGNEDEVTSYLIMAISNISEANKSLLSALRHILSNRS